jgi:hypothetical protein
MELTTPAREHDYIPERSHGLGSPLLLSGGFPWMIHADMLKSCMLVMITMDLFWQKSKAGQRDESHNFHSRVACLRDALRAKFFLLCAVLFFFQCAPSITMHKTTR